MFGRSPGRSDRRLAAEDLERQADTRAADGGRVRDGGALQARELRVVEQLIDEVAAVRTDDRDERLAWRH